MAEAADFHHTLMRQFEPILPQNLFDVSDAFLNVFCFGFPQGFISEKASQKNEDREDKEKEKVKYEEPVLTKFKKLTEMAI